MAVGRAGARPQREDPRRVLALRALGLGDLLTALPALRAARRWWAPVPLVLAAPRAVGELAVAVGAADAALPVGPLEPVPWHGEPPLAAVNLHGSGPQSHRLLLAARPRQLVAYASSEIGNDGPRWDPAEHEVHRWNRLVSWAGAGPRLQDLRVELPGEPVVARAVVVHPGTAQVSRRWPAERFAAVAAALAADGARVVVTGSADEAELVTSVVRAAGLPAEAALAGRVDLPGLVRLVQHAALVVSGDTGIAHLATATGTPSVRMFGPVPPSRWGPLLDVERHVVLYRGDGGTGEPFADHPDPGLLGIEVDEVLGAARGLLPARC
ncbi:MAG TPA: glycosyltransferase family 9 protein [Motilibacteraceae bacterium]|nr:glycosyltransferase family 9 protein [Motilibacteraceae bacterium]